MTKWGGLNTSCSKRELKILSLTFLAILKGCHHYPPIANKESEAQRSHIIDPRSHSQWVGFRVRRVWLQTLRSVSTAPFRETVWGGARCLVCNRELRSRTPLTVCGAFPESTPVFVLTSTTCEMREVLGCFAGQTPYGFLFEQVILKAACENFCC